MALCLLLSGIAEVAPRRTSPVLPEGLLRQIPSTGASPRARDRFLAYAASANPEMLLGLQMLSQNELFGPWLAFSEQPFVPDGRAADWDGVAVTAADPTGDAPGELDLLSVSIAPDGHGNLRVMHRVRGLSAKKKETGVGLNILGLGQHWIQFVYHFHDQSDRGYFNIVRRSDNKVVKSGWMPLQFAAGEVVEAVLPLADFLKRESIPFRDSVTVQAFAGQDAGSFHALPASGRNLALVLALHLADRLELEVGDPMALAMAIVNSQLYAISDEPTQRLIETDLVAHYELYREIVAQQEAHRQAWNIRKAPFVPKLFWADRRRTHELPPGAEVMTEQYYREFIDRPEILARVQHWMVREGLVGDSHGLTSLARSIEQFYYTKAKYRSSMENLELFHRLGWYSAKDLAEARADVRRGLYEREYLGKKRRWDGFGWLNYQWALFTRTGFFMGDCGTATTMQMAMYRMAGLAPVSFQKDGIGKDASASHNFPGYYNVPLGRWSVVQIPPHADYPLAVHYAKPYLHHARHREDWQKSSDGVYYSSQYPMEVAPAAAIVSFFSRGVDHRHMQRLVLSDVGTAPGLFFTPESTRNSDSDGDGIQDDDEARFGTDPNSPDTDKDGYSDLWELEHGLSPLDGSDGPGTFALDGIVRPMVGETRVSAPQGDSKAEREIFDAASLSALLSGDRLLLAVTFHNGIARNQTRLHSFAIESEGDSFWVQWSQGVGMLYRRKGKDFQPVSGAGLYEKTLIGAEFEIPLSHFGNRTNLKITYYAPGWFGGKLQIVADQAGPLELGTPMRTRSAESKPAVPPEPGAGTASPVWERGR